MSTPLRIDIQGLPREHPAKTGNSPDEFLRLATNKKLIKGGKIVATHSELLACLKTDMGLGHGHANAMILYFRMKTNDPKLKESKGDLKNFTKGI